MRAPRGFSLIELLVTLAVAGTLALWVVPAALDQVRRARRAAAQAGLQEAALWLERFRGEHGQYLQTRAGAPMLLPAALQEVPHGAGAAAHYRIALDALDSQSHTLVAVPQRAMAGDPCGSFLLNHLGQQSNRDAARSDCWVRP